MRRREFLSLLGVEAFLLRSVVPAMAQPLRRVGYLGLGTERSELFYPFASGMEQLGWIEGKNIQFEDRWAPTVGLLRVTAEQLAKADVEVIFASSSLLVEAARQAAPTIPIIFATHADPIGVGHVATLPRPGGNITGLSMLLTETVAKQLQSGLPANWCAVGAQHTLARACCGCASASR
jgi:putative ABC transport system substrate-binding protein